MEPTFSMHEEWQLTFLQLVLFSFFRIMETKGAFHRPLTIPRGPDRVDKSMAGRVLIVVQITLRPSPFRTRIESIDEHAGNRCRPRNLNAGFLQVIRQRRNFPVSGPDFDRSRRTRQYVFVQSTSQNL